MKQLKEDIKLQRQIYDHFGYGKDWVVTPLEMIFYRFLIMAMKIIFWKKK